MEYLVQLVFSFLATASLCVIFNAPVKAIPYCGLVGAAGWMIYYIALEEQLAEVIAAFLGAFFVAVCAQGYARRLKTPMIVFIVSGIIPLVPGGLAYNTMRYFVEQNYTLGLETGIRAFLISGAIAMGIVFSEVIFQLFVKFMTKGRTSMQSFIRNKRRL
ncbi:threonine/serine exporter family protein [Ureibacillus sp. FSL K6-8385]|uniref:Threonine/serine exporter n=1 Tax=Ureibacillus terrenus TaxID=118246 RepID=A0A540V5C5_9BACL|nr:threonine/serine exporter family protein [Ureibacillus terrenus]MED3661139.1 threonine/serine exporter family protein [Ureibacillus terrenus]MED3764383.1 threonine/serine exporter family protein [Ureibacillus terrenus]TQE91942.1 threonine/serine exporter [Ureibacillus terrenus]